MGNCLTTKLNGTVNNDRLLPFNGLVIGIRSNNRLRSQASVGNKVLAAGRAGTTINGAASRYLLSTEDIWNIINAGYITFNNKDYIKEIDFSIDYNTLSYMDFRGLCYMPVLQKFAINSEISAANVRGTVEDIVDLPAITWLTISNIQVTGNVAHFANFPTLTTLELYACPLSGDLKDIFDGMVAKGRTSGTLYINTAGPGSTFKYNGETLPYRFVYATFTESGYTVDIRAN